jgi:cobaltochelatase CobN
MSFRKKVYLFAAALAVIALGYASFSFFFAPTKVLVVNAFPNMAADLYLSNDSRRIRVHYADMDKASGFERYNIVLFFGRGLNLSEEQMAGIEKAAAKKVVFTTISTARTNFNFIVHRNITGEQQEKTLQYFNNPNRTNYRNVLRYLCSLSQPDKWKPADYDAPVMIPRDMFYHTAYGQYFLTHEALTSHLKANNLYNENGKNLALISGVTFPMEGNRSHIDTLITRLTHKGYNVYPISSLDKRSDMLRDLHPDAVIYLPVSRLGNDSLIHWLHTENIPVFAPFPLMQQSRDEWLDPIKPVIGASLTTRVVIPEIDGGITPLVVATQNMQANGFYAYMPEDERINRFINLMHNHLSLNDIPNAEKKIAVCYFKSPGKDGLVASGMEVIPSLYNFLKFLRDDGYNVGNLPSLDVFKQRIMQDGVVLGAYAQGAQKEYLAKGNPVRISASQYEDWARQTLTASKYNEVVMRYGEAPGELLTETSENGEKTIAVACVRYGNVLLFPQPRPALGDDEFKLVHGMPVAPPHSYLAPYLYAQKGFDADALIHFGTHGNLEFTPGKNVGLSQHDWADVLTGDLPHFYFYTTTNVGEAIIAKRRTHAVLVTHLTPPFVESGMRQQYSALLTDIHTALGDAEKPDKDMALRIKKEVVRLGLHRDLDLDSITATPYSAEDLEKLDGFIEEIANEKMLGAFYTLGEPYSPRDLATTTLAVSADPLAYQTAKKAFDGGKISAEQLHDFTFITHHYLPAAQKKLTDFLSHSSDHPSTADPDLQDAALYRQQLQASTVNEITSMLRALNGGAVFPAPGGDPVLNPNALPTGRNMYSINAEMTPSPRAWNDGKRLAETALALYKEKHGAYPRKVSYTFWAGEYISSEGATLAQAFQMLGVEPVRDRTGHVVDIQLIPSETLGRPRINAVVQVSGQLRDIAGSSLRMFTEAVRLASAASGEKYPNYVASGTLLQEKTLVEKGISPKDARELSVMRVFGPVNSGYSTGMLAYTENSGRWEKENELVDGYLNNMGAAYGDEANWGSVRQGLFASALAETDMIIQPRQSNTWGPVSLDHVYEFMGGLSLTVKALTGKEPEALIADYRNRNSKRVQNLKEAVSVEVRTTILNPVFIRERMKGDATTAEMFGEIFRNIFGWNVMRPSAIDRELYNELYRTYVLDEAQLGIHAYFDRVNAAAFQSMLSVMLESARRDYWQATDEQLKTSASLLAASTYRHGAACTEMVCDNAKMQQFVAAQLSPPDAADYNHTLQNIRTSNVSSSTDKAVILKKENLSSDMDSADSASSNNPTVWIPVIIIGFILAVYVISKRRN